MVRPKKQLGQHFLTDHNIARKIAASLSDEQMNVLEIGPGTGMLTRYLITPGRNLKCIEIDRESIEHLEQQFEPESCTIIHGDFLRIDPTSFFNEPFAVIGNLPYNISSQIFFKTLEYKNMIPEVVAMIQKEVAVRIAGKPGSKEYGILSVLIQAYYQIDYLFTVNETVFHPPPKVKSGVIKLTRRFQVPPDLDEPLFFKIVKTSFNQRRKTLRNSLKSILLHLDSEKELLSKRPEQLDIADFVYLTKLCKPEN